MTTVEEALGGSTPLARKVKATGPYQSPSELIERLQDVIPTLTEQETIATLNAHPRIGEDPRRLSPHSRKEQGRELVPELKPLNAEYERRFGFRFVVHVAGRPKSEIVQVLKERLGHNRADEMAEGLSAIVAIAKDRLGG